nr:PREDICTED: hepatocyte growth factor-regulated tyrosine kinase substrate [Bemisia tabaci]
MFRTGKLDSLIEAATSNLNLEPPWPQIIKICDLIRQGDVQPKVALAAVKKKLTSINPHTAMYALLVLESMVKNCGAVIHDEVASLQFMEQLHELVKTTQHKEVKEKILELIQGWAFAFRKNQRYRAVQDVVTLMKAEGCSFPTLNESDAMFTVDTAPEWAEGHCCHRCRDAFTLFNRKHHCRACGQVFCGKCASQTSTLPNIGFEKEVRVCDVCYEKSHKPPAITNKSDESLPSEYLNSSLAQQSQTPPRKTEQQLREEEELNLAIALSQSEAEAQKNKSFSRASSLPSRTANYSPPVTESPEKEDTDPELAHYLNRAYWENRQQNDTGTINRSPSAPTSAQTTAPTLPVSSTSSSSIQQLQNGGIDNNVDMDEFVSTLKSQVDVFVNRIKSNYSRGRSIANDSTVQTPFLNITAMHSKLLNFIQEQDDSRAYYEGLQDKLTQVKDARAALDALREEHKEKLRREAEMAERQRQSLMAQKLDTMRKKKQEYLQYQRQLALQRIQEQEREMLVRQEQQKQQYLMGSMNPYASVPGFESQVPQSLPQQGAPYSIPPQMPPNYSYPMNVPGMPPLIRPGPQPQFPPNLVMGPQGMVVNQNVPPMIGETEANRPPSPSKLGPQSLQPPQSLQHIPGAPLQGLQTQPSSMPPMVQPISNMTQPRMPMQPGMPNQQLMPNQHMVNQPNQPVMSQPGMMPHPMVNQPNMPNQGIPIPVSTMAQNQLPAGVQYGAPVSQTTQNGIEAPGQPKPVVQSFQPGQVMASTLVANLPDVPNAPLGPAPNSHSSIPASKQPEAQTAELISFD